jgi:hypothetical protein
MAVLAMLEPAPGRWSIQPKGEGAAAHHARNSRKGLDKLIDISKLFILCTPINGNDNLAAYAPCVDDFGASAAWHPVKWRYP